MKGQKKKQNSKATSSSNNHGITLVALVVSIVVMLILAGVSINAVVGDNGIITQAQNAKIDLEEAEVWEQIQMILIDGYASGLEGEELCDYVNAKFEEQGIDAVMSYLPDNDQYAYVVTYGVYSRYSAYLDKNLNLILTVAAVEGTIYDETQELTGDWKVELLSDGTYKIIEYKGEEKASIAIPNVMNDGIKVTQLGDDVFSDGNGIWLESVTFAEGLESIGASTFQNCTSLSCNISFPSTLTSIGSYAFYYCSGISADLDAIVAQGITMGKMAFYGCTGLTGEMQTFVDNVLSSTDTTITEGMFSGFSGLTGTLTIPYYIETIEEGAFSGCSSVEALVFEDTAENPSRLTSIGDSAFYKCTNMAGALIIPDTVTSIGEKAFYQDASFTSLTLSSAITSIGAYAFDECTEMKNDLIIPSTLSNIKDYVFYRCNFTSVTFADGGAGELVISGECAFGGSASINNKSLTTVTLPSDRNTKITGSGAFRYCTILEKIENVETTNGGNTYGLCYVGDSVFQYCYKLKTLPSQTICSTIGEFAYYNCYALGYVETTQVSGYDNCTDIINWLAQSSVVTVGTSAFKNESDTSYLGGVFAGTITKTDGLTLTPGAGAFTGTHVEKATVLNLATTTDGAGNTVTKTEITDSEFAGVTKFTDGSGTTITDIVIPKEITKIGDKAFAGCTSITSVTFEDSSTLESWGTYTFYECSSLAYCEIPTGAIGTDSDGNTTYGITKIPDYTFAYSGLTSIGNVNESTGVNYIPDNITVVRTTSLYKLQELECRNPD